MIIPGDVTLLKYYDYGLKEWKTLYSRDDLRGATEPPGKCPDCGLLITQTMHVCCGRGILSASDAAALIAEASSNQKTPGNDTLQEKRTRSRRDVQEKRRELRRKRVGAQDEGNNRRTL